jgi:hypothetical protein
LKIIKKREEEKKSNKYVLIELEKTKKRKDFAKRKYINKGKEKKKAIEK